MTQDFIDMCSNVAAYGVLQTALVRPSDPPGHFMIIAGEFRLEAARKKGAARVAVLH